jgi:hypothetical protein
MDLGDIPSALLVAGATAIGAMALQSLRKPAQTQDQMMMLAMGGLAAFALRHFESKGAATEGHNSTLATHTADIKTLYRRTDELAEDRDEHAQAMHELTLDVQRVVNRFDQWLDFQEGEARVRKARPPARPRAPTMKTVVRRKRA